MKPTVATASPIAVDALRIGMVIHVDGGWLSHPFPRSRFRIESEAQLAALRTFGPQTVLCYPADELAAPALPPVPTAASAAPPPPQTARPSARSRRSLVVPLPRSDAELQAACERRHAAATQAHRLMLDNVRATPRLARRQADALASSLLDDMRGDHALSIRLLQQGGGDALSTHSVNVAVVSMLMGRSFGFDDADLHDLGLGALLHDIGKIGLPAQANRLGAQPTPGELALYRSHVARGLAHATALALAGDALSVVAQHHEQMDGSGFPARLKGDALTVAARIVALVNRYDRLCNPYDAATALGPHEAVSLLFTHNDGRFDTTILAAFIKLIGVYPPGSTVQLTDNRYAIVTAINAARPLKPCVVPYDAQVPRRAAVRLDLQKTADIGIVRSVRRGELPAAVLHYLAPPQRTSYYVEPAEVEMLAA